MAIDFDELWRQVKANHELLNSCPRHRFTGWTPIHALRADVSATIRCDNCKGLMPKVMARTYVLGYMAAGGNPEDIWPGWSKPCRD